MALCELFMLQKLKTSLKGSYFGSLEHSQSNVMTVLKEHLKNYFQRCMAGMLEYVHKVRR
jgi:hypothetical protein